MKKFSFIATLVVAVVAFVLTSCGGKKDVYEVTVDNTTIGGKLSEYFSLVDKTYKYKVDILDKVAVELKCIKPLPENVDAFIGIDILDEDGTVILAVNPTLMASNNSDVLRQATPGQIVSIQLEHTQDFGDEKPAKIRLSSVLEGSSGSVGYSSSTSSFSEESYSGSMNDGDFTWLAERTAGVGDLQGLSKDELRILRNAVYARHNFKFKSADLQEYFEQFDWYNPLKNDVTEELNSIELENIKIIQEAEKGNLSAASSSGSSKFSGSSSSSFGSSQEYNDSGSGSADWNEILDSYERYADKYVSLTKKIINDDMSVLTDFYSLAEKAEDLDKKLSKAQNQLSSSQWSRYLKITQKISEAVQKVAKKIEKMR